MIYKAIIYYDQVAFYAILPGRFFSSLVEYVQSS